MSDKHLIGHCRKGTGEQRKQDGDHKSLLHVRKEQGVWNSSNHQPVDTRIGKALGGDLVAFILPSLHWIYRRLGDSLFECKSKGCCRQFGNVAAVQLTIT
ncbi:hypothetical protein SDC9_72151 [bioreactor metagenome]|uniref:Uncharacterized protein n=1 Tax=bioreactor metagenome TaxID=1076179 RepID=A0A644YGN5_9ZZZZ